MSEETKNENKLTGNSVAENLSGELTGTIRALLQPGKGLLAADESTGTIGKRLASIKVESTEGSRQAYRQMLFTTAGLNDYISGVILYDETLRQKTTHGVPFADVLKQAGITPGIKVDLGTQAIPAFPGEKITEGLDGLRKRLAEYKSLGARFAKWRAVIGIGAGIPTTACIQMNASSLGRYAALCQEVGLVPIVEPEVLMDGDHDIERCEEVTSEVLHRVFDELYRQRVKIESILLKPNMVVPGAKAKQQAEPREVAESTLRCLSRVLPPALPGVAFLSGGQEEVEATKNLDAINRLSQAPWTLTFSYGRALQASALKAWGGKAGNVIPAQKVLRHRSWCNHKACLGKYDDQIESEFQ
jgi:fructose-bisphosphate aldolase class I